MTVRVCDRGSGRDYVGVTIRTITISDRCAQCDGPRGVDTIRNHNFHEDGDWLSVDTWKNPCGHVDMYSAVLAEARKRAELLELHEWDELLFGGFYCMYCTPGDADDPEQNVYWPCPPLRSAGVTDEEAVALITAERAAIEAEHRAKAEGGAV